MNRSEVIDVLSAVAAADRRTVGQADVGIWQGVIGDVPKDFALQAVRDHLREQPDVWLQPGHVWQRARALMRDQLEREPDELREARQAALDAKAVEDHAEQTPWVGPLKHRRPPFNPLMQRCPHCGARPGTHCTVLGTNRRPHNGTHPAREDAARQAQSLDATATRSRRA